MDRTTFPNSSIVAKDELRKSRQGIDRPREVVADPPDVTNAELVTSADLTHDLQGLDSSRGLRLWVANSMSRQSMTNCRKHESADSGNVPPSTCDGHLHDRKRKAMRLPLEKDVTEAQTRTFHVLSDSEHSDTGMQTHQSEQLVRKAEVKFKKPKVRPNNKPANAHAGCTTIMSQSTKQCDGKTIDTSRAIASGKRTPVHEGDRSATTSIIRQSHVHSSHGSPSLSEASEIDDSEPDASETNKRFAEKFGRGSDSQVVRKRTARSASLLMSPHRKRMIMDCHPPHQFSSRVDDQVFRKGRDEVRQTPPSIKVPMSISSTRGAQATENVTRTTLCAQRSPSASLKHGQRMLQLGTQNPPDEDSPDPANEHAQSIVHDETDGCNVSDFSIGEFQRAEDEYIDRLVEEIQRVREQNKSLERTNDGWKSKLSRKQQSLDRTETTLKAEQKHISQLEDRIRHLEDQLERREDSLLALRTENVDLQRASLQARRDLLREQANSNRLQTSITQLEGLLKEVVADDRCINSTPDGQEVLDTLRQHKPSMSKTRSIARTKDVTAVSHHLDESSIRPISQAELVTRSLAAVQASAADGSGARRHLSQHIPRETDHVSQSSLLSSPASIEPRANPAQSISRPSHRRLTSIESPALSTRESQQDHQPTGVELKLHGTFDHPPNPQISRYESPVLGEPDSAVIRGPANFYDSQPRMRDDGAGLPASIKSSHAARNTFQPPREDDMPESDFRFLASESPLNDETSQSVVSFADFRRTDVDDPKSRARFPLPFNTMEDVWKSLLDDWKKYPKFKKESHVLPNEICLTMRAKKLKTEIVDANRACIRCEKERRPCVRMIQDGMVKIVPLRDELRQGDRFSMTYWVRDPDVPYV